MQQSAIPYDLREDYREDRHSYLGFVLLSVLVIGAMTFIAYLVGQTVVRGEIYGLFALLGISAFIAWRLQVAHRTDTAIWILLLGFSGMLIGALLVGESVLRVQVLLIVPLLLSYLLLRAQDIVNFSLLVVIATVAISLYKFGFAGFLQDSFFFVILYGVIALIGYAYTQNMVERVQGALATEQKNTVRAEYFFEQSEELKRALLDVQFYSAKLEEANTELAKARMIAEKASNAKTTFLSNMSHELRTPLNVVIGYTETMLKMPHMFENVALPRVYHPYVEMIHDNGTYLLELINDVLDMSKVEAGKLELYQSETSIPDLARSVMATAVGLVKEKPVQLRTDIPANLPLVWADAKRVRQILLNLLSNAIKFTASGSVMLRARAEEGCVRISVIDTGIGIPAEALATIFDRFAQAEKDTSRKYGGTGLGLDISKQLVIMHGGDLTVESEVGRGSTFSLTLPLVPEDAITLSSREAVFDGARIFAIGDDAGAPPELIMIASGNTDSRQRWLSAFEEVGYAVLPTSSEGETLDAAAALIPSLIVLDERLSDADWETTLEKLRAQPETVELPILVCVSSLDGVREQHDMRLMSIDYSVAHTALVSTARELMEKAQSALPSMVI
ncbi:MAG: ATP-binding protein [Chloroflexota bacterium]|nr:ATP-binding protein [Chloroflexota bacterium]